MAAPGLPSADNRPVGLEVVVGMKNVPKATEKAFGLNKGQIDLMKEITKAKAEKAKDEDVLGRIANGEKNKPKYDSSNIQQDIARFGGGSGNVNGEGKAIQSPNAEEKQINRFEQAKKTGEQISSVMFYMDLLKIQNAGGNVNEEITRLKDRNPSFKALGVETLPLLQAKAQEAMLTDPTIGDILGQLSNLPPGDIAKQKAVFEDMVFTDQRFRDTLSANLHAVHEKILKLGEMTPEGKAKLATDTENAKKTLDDKAARITDAVSRAYKGGGSGLPKETTNDEVVEILKASNNESDFKRNLAGKMGIVNYGAVAEYLRIEKELAGLNKQLEGNLNDTPVEKTIERNTGNTKTTTRETTHKDGSQRKMLDDKAEAINKRIVELKGINNFDTDLATYRSVSDFVDSPGVKSEITEGISSSRELNTLSAKTAPEGKNISTNLDTRLSREDDLLAEMKTVIGKSLAEVWKKDQGEADTLNAEIYEKRIAEAGSEMEKKLIIAEATRYVDFNASTKETTIHGDNIMEGIQLLTLEDQGVMLEMARVMELTTDAKVKAIFAKTPDGKKSIYTPAQQIEQVNKIFDKIKENDKTNKTNNFEVLEKMMKNHGSEYRQKMYGSYLTMDAYLKEGVNGHLLRIGRKIKYEGSRRSMWEMVSGDGNKTVNYDQLNQIYKYCEPDITEALEQNSAANNFMKRMEAKGMAGNPGLLKKLAWLLFIVLGLGSGLGAAGVIPGLSAGGALGAAGGAAAAGGLGFGALKVGEAASGG